MLASLLTHAPICAYFSKNHKDFIVRERAAYEFSGSGEWLIVRACKKDLTTKDLLKDIAAQIGAKAADIGYAGLKDRQGYTEQFLSLPRRFERQIAAFSHPKARLEPITAHENKLKIGHLKGNNFFIRLKKITPVNALKLEQSFANLAAQGFVNYFGYQRFGRDGANAQTAREVLTGSKKFGKKVNKFLISALQSELFNEFLAARVRLSRLCAGLKQREIAALLADWPALTAQILPAGEGASGEGGFGGAVGGFGGAVGAGGFGGTVGLAGTGGDLSAADIAQIPTPQASGGFLLLPGETFMHFPKGKVFSEDLPRAAERFAARDIAPAGLILGKSPAFGAAHAGAIARAVFAPHAALLSREAGSWRHQISFIDGLKTRYDEQKAHFCVEFFLQKGCYATTVLEQALGCELSD